VASSASDRSLNLRPSGPSSIKVKLLALFVGIVILPALLVLLLEGGSSLFLLGLSFWRREHSQRPAPENWYARYDAELGWVGRASISIPDLSGPGVGVHTNAQGFRETGSAGAEFAPAKLGVICSGDSFTFGDGVADDRTWCARLAVVDPRLATVNMGQSGYGVDQAYLGYKRDGRKLEYGIHLFTCITNDLIRMQLW
jgi:hypothetical protein